MDGVMKRGEHCGNYIYIPNGIASLFFEEFREPPTYLLRSPLRHVSEPHPNSNDSKNNIIN